MRHRRAHTESSSEEYQGWKNRATWNVALWVNNDEGLYREAVAYVQRCKARRVVAGERFATPRWRVFVESAGLSGQKTPDGYAYDGIRLDYKALSAMLKEMA